MFVSYDVVFTWYTCCGLCCLEWILGALVILQYDLNAILMFSLIVELDYVGL